MKISRTLLVIIMCVISFVTITGCKKKCKNDLPQARIINNSTYVASVQIKTSDGNTVNINNVQPGTTSAYASYATGNITFTISFNKNNYVQTVSAGYCNSYDIAVDNNGTISVSSTEKKYE